ncbi:MAG: hypothetical protein U0X41_05825 [Chitinophagales bacterium]
MLNRWNRSADVNKHAMVALITRSVIDRLVKEGHFPRAKSRSGS